MKHILYISYKLPSVTTTFVYREIEALRKSGYRITAISMNQPRPNEVHPEALPFYKSTFYLDRVKLFNKLLAQIKLILTKPLIFFKMLWIVIHEKEVKGFRDRLRLLWHFIGAGYLYTALNHHSTDQIHAAFLSGPASVAFFLSRYLRIPFSFTIHASNIFVDPIMLGRKLTTSKKVVTISRYNKKYLLEKYGKLLESKIHIIHCGVDIEKFRRTSGKCHKVPIILAVGQLTERKGFVYLLEACAILKQKELSFKCIIVGDGEEKEILNKKNKSLGLDNYVSFLGRKLQDEVLRLLDKATIFCLPSIITNQGGREGIPVALMEAMVMELPVVSTKSVGIPELIEHRKDGMLVPPKDSKSLAETLEFLLTKDDIRVELGQAAREKVIKKFNLAHVPKRFEVIFN